LAFHLFGSGTRIILLGYDMMVDGKQRHWFGDHPQGLNVASNYTSFMNRFKTIRPAEYGLEILNATRRTALTCFPCHRLEDL